MVDQVELRSGLLELAGRCERATWPCDTAAAAEEIVAIKSAICHLVAGRGYDAYSADYTNSLDAAMTLVPNNWRVRDLTQWVSDADAESWSLELRRKDRKRHCVEAEAATAALALCAAALRSRTPTTPERSDG